MFYIHDDWIKNKSNKSDVHKILNKHLYTDLRDDNAPNPVELVIKELIEIDETIIIEKINDGTIVLGG